MGLQGTRDPTQNNQNQDRRRHGHSQRQDRHFRAGQGRAQGHPDMRHQPAFRESKTVLGWAALSCPALLRADLSWTELDCHLTTLALFACISKIRAPYPKQILRGTLSQFTHAHRPAPVISQLTIQKVYLRLRVACYKQLLEKTTQTRYDTTQETHLLGDLG